MKSEIDSMDLNDTYNRCEPAGADAISKEMQSVLEDVDAFLAAWCDRVESDFETVTSQANAESDLKERIEAFQRKVQSWQAKRDSEAARIEEQSTQLTEAWLQLESEQRTLLQLKEQRAPVAVDRLPQVASPVPTAKESHAIVNKPIESVSSQEASDSLSSRIAYRHASGAARSDSAIEQFQRLKQEVDRGRSDSAPQ